MCIRDSNYSTQTQVTSGPTLNSTSNAANAYTNDNGITSSGGFLSASYNQMGELCWINTATQSSTCLLYTSRCV